MVLLFNLVLVVTVVCLLWYIRRLFSQTREAELRFKERVSQMISSLSEKTSRIEDQEVKIKGLEHTVADHLKKEIAAALLLKREAMQ